jgi:hypothetical protein
MIEAVSIASGFFAGFAVGRWWILLAAAPLGMWVGFTTDVDEASPVVLGVGYAVLAAIGIAAGFAVRRSHARLLG